LNSLVSKQERLRLLMFIAFMLAGLVGVLAFIRLSDGKMAGFADYACAAAALFLLGIACRNGLTRDEYTKLALITELAAVNSIDTRFFPEDPREQQRIAVEVSGITETRLDYLTRKAGSLMEKISGNSCPKRKGLHTELDNVLAEIVVLRDRMNRYAKFIELHTKPELVSQ